MGWRDLVANVQGTAARTFPEEVLYTPQGLSEIAITGVFREPFVASNPGGDMQVSSTQPTLDVVLADLPQAPSALPEGLGDRLVVSRLGTRFRVVEIEPDGEGMAKLYLHEKAIG